MATKAPQKAEVAYDPAVALDFFKSAGKPETFAEGAKIFSESERAIPLLRKSKMYLLLKGEVELRAKKKAIGELPEKERQVLALYYFEELTMKEVGMVLGVGESRVSQIHSMAVVRLRARMAELTAANSKAARKAAGAR